VLAAACRVSSGRGSLRLPSGGPSAHALPPGLLLAIDRVESGRRDPVTGRVAAWPWTINAAGLGRLFDRREDAIIETQALQVRGVSQSMSAAFRSTCSIIPQPSPA
jgi:hypothetical protein